MKSISTALVAIITLKEQLIPTPT